MFACILVLLSGSVTSSTTPLRSGPLRLSDLTLDRAFHAVLPISTDGPSPCPLPATLGVAVTEISGIPHWDASIVRFPPAGPALAAGSYRPFRVKVYVDGLLVSSRHVKGGDSRNGSLAFDPPLIARPGQLLHIAFEHGPFPLWIGENPPMTVFAGDAPEITVSGWILYPGDA